MPIIIRSRLILCALAAWVSLGSTALAQQSVDGSGTEKSKEHEQGETTLPEVTVTDIADQGSASSYVTGHATTATKTDTPIFDTPASVQVINRKIIEDQKAVRLEDTLRNVSGVQPAATLGRVQDDFFIRGFQNGLDVDSVLYRNGTRLTGALIVPGFVEQIEVLKGPGSILYGRAEAGGLINVVTKKPLATAHHSLEQSFGSFDLFRTTLDSTGPIDAEGKIRYRIIGDFLNQGSFRDFQSIDQQSFYGALSWDITPDTRIELNAEYRTAELSSDEGVGLPTRNGRPAPIPVSRYLGNPEFEFLDDDDFVTDLTVTHHFNEDWSVRFKGTYAYETRDGNSTFTFLPLIDDRVLPRFVFGVRDLNHDTGYAALELTGHFDTGPLKHTLLTGADYYQERRGSSILFGDVGSIDILTGVENPPAPTITGTFPFELRNEWYGLFLQDQVRITDQLQFLAGLRFDDAVAGRAPQDLIEERTSAANGISHRYGLVYQPVPWLSAYGHYNESFGPPNPGAGRNGESFGPQRGNEYEFGLKGEWLEGALTANLAYFELTRRNTLTADPLNPAFSIATGEARSNGVELDINGRLFDRLDLIATYAFLETEITADNNPGRLGNRLPNAPRHSGSLALTYDLTPEFKVGAAVYAVDERAADLDNLAVLPGYVRLDLLSAYRFRVGQKTAVTAQLNVQNVLDNRIFVAPGIFNDVSSVTPGAPLTVLGSLRVDFE